MTIASCPYCGEGPTLAMEEGESSVYCGKCQTGGPVCESASDAVKAWNRLAMAVQITEAAWLGRETTMAAQSCRRGSIVSPPGATLERAARGLVQKLGDMLDQWGEDLDA